jgi:hypothetical protein
MPYAGVLADQSFRRIIPENRPFLGHAYPEGFDLLHADMPPETVDLIADDFLKPVDERER